MSLPTTNHDLVDDVQGEGTILPVVATTTSRHELNPNNNQHHPPQIVPNQAQAQAQAQASPPPPTTSIITNASTVLDPSNSPPVKGQVVEGTSLPLSSPLSSSTISNNNKEDVVVKTSTVIPVPLGLPQQQQYPPPAPKGTSKYLCFAPRPEEYESYWNKIMNGGGSAAQLQQQVRTTLQFLYPRYSYYYTTKTIDTLMKHCYVASTNTTTIPVSTTTNTTSNSSSMNTTTTPSTTITNSNNNNNKNIGPGRKSNAEYAIQFYEYLLQRLQNETTVVDTTDVVHVDVVDDNYNKNIVVEREKLNEENAGGKAMEEEHDGEVIYIVKADDKEDVSNTGSHDHATPKTKCCVVCCRSVDDADKYGKESVPIPKSSSTNCTSGRNSIIQCTTCPNVFHKQCVRPKIEDDEDGTNGDEDVDEENTNEDVAPDITTDPAITATTKGRNRSSGAVVDSSSYTCAYCILATYKRNDKYRKTAAAAVRFMARLRNQITSGKPRKVSKGHHRLLETTTTATTTTTSVVGGSIVVDSEGSSKITYLSSAAKSASTTPTNEKRSSGSTSDSNLKKSNDLNKLSDSDAKKLSAIIHSEHKMEKDTERLKTDVTMSSDSNTSESQNQIETTTGNITTGPTSPRSSQRSRKQPTLYNPQDGPASRWQTDELKEWKLQRAKEEEEEEQQRQQAEDERRRNHSLYNNSSRRRGARRDGKGSTVLCIFCRDDPNIPVCVFCACRVCFGKQCQNELLLCDDCDDEYHTFCLNPPLQCVPGPNQPWYCDACTNVRTKQNNNSTNTNDISDKNESLGRPSRRSSSSTVDTSKKSIPVVATTSRITETEETNNSPTNQRRSLRSPKLSVAAMMMLSNSKESAAEKIAQSVPSEKGVTKTNKFIFTKPPAPQQKQQQPLKRPRGRPPKNADTSPMNSGSEHSSTTNASKQRTIGDGTVIVKRKPGRPKLSESAHSFKITKIASATQPTQVGRKRGRPPSAETLAKRAKLELMWSNKNKTISQQQRLPKTTTKHKSSFTGQPLPTGVTTTSTSQLSISIPSNSSDPNHSETSIIVPPVTVSRSGRTVKRSNFHDELGEGEQHLKSVRYSSENLKGTPSPSPRTINNTNLSFSEVQHSFDRKASTNANSKVIEGSLQVEPLINRAVLAHIPSTPTAPTASFHPHHDGVLNDPGPSLRQSAVEGLDEHVDTNPDYVMNNDDDEIFENLKMPATYESGNDGARISDVTTSAVGHPIDINMVHETAQDQQQQTQHHHEQHQQIHSSGLDSSKQPRRKPGARECMQISRRFGVKEIPQQYMDILLDYCNRGKVEHLIRMRERLDEHSRFLEMQLAGLETLVKEHGESDIVVPLAPPSPDRRHE